MSEQDYKAGLSGAEWHPDMNREDYERGVAKRNFGRTIFSDWPKVDVPGVAYTLILVSPLLLVTHPVLGLACNGGFAVAALLAGQAGAGTAALLIGFVVGIVAFFPGLWLEAQASQMPLYRVARTCWRLLAPLGLTIMVSFDDSGFHFRPEAVSSASGEMLGAGIIVGLVIHFVCSLLDRLYFPVVSQVRKEREQVAKGIRPTRHILKRWIYGWLWLIPVFIVCNLAIRGVVGQVAEGPEAVKAFYESYAYAVYAADAVIWFLLCLFGVLPGTSKRAKMMVDHLFTRALASK